MTERRRLAPEQRRDQLLDIGARAFARLAYEDVRMLDVAAEAGVSRGLIYRYFPTKRDLFAAIYQRASDRLLASAELSDDEPLLDQVVAGLDAHIDFFVANPRTVLAANRGPLAGDPVVQGIISEELAVLRRRMLDATGLRGRQRAVASAGLAAWLSFVRTVCVEWLAQRAFSREELREMCLRALMSVLDAPGDPRDAATRKSRAAPRSGCRDGLSR